MSTVADGVDRPDDLVPGNGPGSTRAQVSLGKMQVGPAHAARRDPNPDVPGRGLRDRAVDAYERMRVDGTGSVDDPRFHGSNLRTRVLDTGRCNTVLGL